MAPCCNVPVSHEDSKPLLAVCVGFMQTSPLSCTVPNLLIPCNQVNSCFTTKQQSGVDIHWVRAYQYWYRAHVSVLHTFPWLGGFSLYFWVLLRSVLLILLIFSSTACSLPTSDITMHATPSSQLLVSETKDRLCLHPWPKCHILSISKFCQSTTKLYLRSVPISPSPLPPGPDLNQHSLEWS